MANLSEVQDAVTKKGVTEKGVAAANGNQVTDAQAYNYVAKGGTSDSDFLPNSQVPQYTKIADNADIGIELPVIKVNTKNETGVEVSYGVTKDGVVFVWPPYLYEREYYITSTDTVTNEKADSIGYIAIKIAEQDLTIKTDENGRLDNISAIENDDANGGNDEENGDNNEENGGNEENVDTPLTEEEKEKLSKLEVGDYIAFPQEINKQSTIDYTILANEKNLNEWYGVTSSNAQIKSEAVEWKILDINKETGELLLTTNGVANLIDTSTNEKTKIIIDGVTGYVNAINELNRICKELYSITYNGKVYEARSLNVDDINKLEKYDVESKNPNPVRYAYYLGQAEETPNVEINGKIYIGTKHDIYLTNGNEEPKFYMWDDPTSGKAQFSTGINDYRVPTKTTPVLVTENAYSYNLSDATKKILGTGESWLASLCTEVNEEYASFDVRHICGMSSSNAGYSDDMDADYACNSNGSEYGNELGIRPVVSISFRLIDFEGVSTEEGTSSTLAWKIK